MAPRIPRSKPQRKRGRPKVDWDPWLAKMHDFVLRGETDRRASRIVAEIYRDEIPQGSAHGRRSDESTARLLRKYYSGWLEQQAEREALRARNTRMAKAMQDMLRVFDTPEFRGIAKTSHVISKCLAPLDLSWTRAFSTLFSGDSEPPDPSFSMAIKSQKRVK